MNSGRTIFSQLLDDLPMHEFRKCVARYRGDHRVRTFSCSRWHVELFFKWIKQHLRIKAFVGTSPNALKTQVWTAVCAYLLVAIVRKRLNLDIGLYTILQILSVSLFEKTPILRAFSQQPLQIAENVNCNQLILFNI